MILSSSELLRQPNQCLSIGLIYSIRCRKLVMASSSSPPQDVSETGYTVLEIAYKAMVKELEDTYKRLTISQYPDKVSEMKRTGLEFNPQATLEEIDNVCKRLAMAEHPESAPFAGDEESLDSFNPDIILPPPSAFRNSGIAGLSSFDNVTEPTADEEAKRLEGRTRADDGLLESFRKEVGYKNKLALLEAGNEYHSHEWIETQNKLDRELNYQTGRRKVLEELANELGY